MINYIKGYYVLVVEGIDTEKYLNFICKNRVPIYNVKRIDKTKVEFSVSRSDLKKIKNNLISCHPLARHLCIKSSYWDNNP